jgi:Tfp pilus tip-associated adhesin PilY1
MYKKYHFVRGGLAVLAASTLLNTSMVSAGPGVLSDIPLPFVVAPYPNILLLLDDSGSMGFLPVITVGGQSAHNLNASGSNSSSPTDGALSESREHGAANGDIALWEMCVGVNGIAYNPKVQYFPWAGSRKNGGLFENAIPEVNNGVVTKLPGYVLPYISNITHDLKNHMYVDWNDVNDDEKYDYKADGIQECGGDIDSYEELLGKDGRYNYKMGEKDSDNKVITGSTNKYGVLHDSGGAGKDYQNNEELSFTIDVPGGSTESSIIIKVQFLNLDGTKENDEYADTVKIYEGLVANSAKLVKTLEPGNTKSYLKQDLSFEVTGSQVHIAFESGIEKTREGFQLTWRHSDTNETIISHDVRKHVKDGVLTIDECGRGNCVLVSSLGATVSKPGDFQHNTQQNYANWYSYYRNRYFVATQALSRVVDGSEVRMGLATIHGANGALIKSMNVAENKKSLQDSLFSINYRSGSTPLKEGLLNAGKYFDAHDNPPDNFFGSANSNVKHAPEEFTISDTASSGGAKPGNSGYYSPILNKGKGGQCQQNFALVFTDGAYDDEFTESEIDAIGNVDGEEDPRLSDGRIYADSQPATLADIALKYFRKDLVNDDLLDDQLSVNLHDETITHQHMTTYTIGFGVEGTLTDVPPTTLSADGTIDVAEWPDPGPTENTAEKIDDLRHAAFNGRGKFFSAFETQALTENLDKVITDISERNVGVGVGASFTSHQLDSGTLRFATLYNSESWWGDLVGFRFNTVTQVFDKTWSADSILENQYSTGAARAGGEGVPGGRQIITYNGSEAIPFAFPSDYESLRGVSEVDGDGNQLPATLNANQITDLLTNRLYVTADTPSKKIANQLYGTTIANYLRGNDTYDGKSLEGAALGGGEIVPTTAADPTINLIQFRDRFDHYYGGFIHSQPQYVGATPTESYSGDTFPGESTYTDFATTLSRRSMVYTGANDGMLHGFYAENLDENTLDAGQEVFAYIPSMVSDPEQGGKGLHELAESAYNNLPYADGMIDVKDVFLDADGSPGKEWRTYLAAGLRGGGKGIYVLDVTQTSTLEDAEVNVKDIVVKEFTHDDLGYVYGKPTIRLMNNNRWAAIVPNGYNNYPKGDGTAKLFIIYLDDLKEGDEFGTGGIFNNGQSDYSIIDASTHVWPNLGSPTCVKNVTCPAVNAPVYVRAYYSDDNGNTSYRYNEFSAASYPANFVCNTDVGMFDEVPGLDLISCDISDRDGNGLSPITPIDTGGDVKVDRVYAGDLHGNLWAFDLSKPSPEEWKVSYDDSNGTPEPLFVACNANSLDVNTDLCPVEDRQPIIAAPEVVAGKLTSGITGSEDLLVFFGTGRYLTVADKADDSQQGFYAVLDAGESNRLLTKEDLSPRQISLIDDSDTSNGDRTIDAVSEELVYGEGQDEYLGWYMPLLDQKERIHLASQVLADLMTFVTIVPGDSVCSASSGYSYLMLANLLDGQSPDFNTIGDGSNIDGIRIGGIVVGYSIYETKEGTVIEISKDGGHDDDGYKDTNTPDTPNTDTFGASESDLAAARSAKIRAAGIKSWSILK